MDSELRSNIKQLEKQEKCQEFVFRCWAKRSYRTLTPERRKLPCRSKQPELVPSPLTSDAKQSRAWLSRGREMNRQVASTMTLSALQFPGLSLER